MTWVPLKEDSPSAEVWWNRRAPHTDGAATRLAADPAYQDDETAD